MAPLALPERQHARADRLHPVERSETSAPVPPICYPGAQFGAALKDAATPVQVGTNDVLVTVTVEYLIG